MTARGLCLEHPLFHQRDVLVGRLGDSNPVAAEQLPPQAIGTVLGYTYPTCNPCWTKAD